MRLRTFAFALVLALVPVRDASALASAASQPPPNVVARHASLPLLFAAVRADDEPTYFVARAGDHAVKIGREGLHIHAADRSKPPLGILFVNGNPKATLRGSGDFAVMHVLKRGEARHLPAYARVEVQRLYPGIDVAFHAQARVLEYDMIVAPHADPSVIEFAFDGATEVALDDRGDLVVAAAHGSVTLKRPIAYQDVGRERREVGSRFAIAAHRVRIELDAYDASRALVIDPVVSYATFVGGSSIEQGTAIAVDGAGNAYVTGYTQSTDFPLANAYDRTIGKRGDVEVFVAKLNAAGTGLVWSTYLGGSTGTDRAVGIAVDASGNVYVTGQTSGSDFPTTAGAWQKGNTAGGGFVAKLSAAGNALVYSTYIAGATPSSIAVDASGNAYVAGSATSSFLTTANALQPASANPAGSTGFVLKLNDAGSSPIFSTFLGGSGGEDATSLALDARGNAYVGGWTTSSDFPVMNGLQTTKRSVKDGFVTKFSSDGRQLLYSTLLGGSLDDSVNAIAVDAAGSAYVAGETYSADFPVKSGFQMGKAGYLLVNSSLGNAFVAKLSPSGNAIVYASFLGGEVCQSYCQSGFGLPQIPGDVAYGIGVDAVGHAYVSGLATSWTFPLFDSTASRKLQDNQDSAFVTKVGINGAQLMWSTFVRTGFSSGDNHWTRFPPGSTTGIAIDAQGAAYVTGDADGSSAFPATAGSFQPTSSGVAAIVAKFVPAAMMTLATSNAVTDTQTPVTLTATVSGSPTIGTVTFVSDGGYIGSASLAGNRASVDVTLPVGIHALTALLYVPGNAIDAAAVTQVVDIPLVCN